MKVYTKIVYDKDDNIIEEHSYNYNGPVSQAKKSWEMVEKALKKASKIPDNILKYKTHEKVWVEGDGIGRAKKLSSYYKTVPIRPKDEHGNEIVNGISTGNNPNEETLKAGESHENILHNFATYNTLFTLSGLSEEELKSQIYFSNAPHDIIARSGGIGNANVTYDSATGPSYNSQIAKLAERNKAAHLTGETRQAGTNYEESLFFLETAHDIFFENVNILSTTGPNSERGLANFTKMEFSLHEPFGISLVEKIRSATFINGYLDYQDAPLLLTIEWKGWDEHGKEVKNSTLKRKIPIRIVRVEFEVDAGGAKYQCVAVAADDFAHDDRFKFPRRNITIARSTWFDWSKELKKQLNEQMENEKKEGLRQENDEYNFHLSAEVVQDAEDWGYGATIHAEAKQPGRAGANMSAKIAAVKSTIDEHTSLVKLFEDAIRNGLGYTQIANDFWYSIAKKFMNDSSIKSKATPESVEKVTNYLTSKKFEADLKKEENQYVNWFMIKPKFEVNYKKYDYIRKLHPKIITYTAVRQKLHVLKFIKPGISLGNINWSAYVRKKYNYMYTGENLDIQNLKIDYKSAYYMRNLRPFIKDEKEHGVIKDFKDKFEDNLNKIYGVEDHPDIPFRQEVSIQKGYSTTNPTDPKIVDLAVESQQFYDYLTNPQADMVKIELTILGDPAYVCQDQFTNLTGTSPTFANQGSWNSRFGSFNSESYQPLMVLNYKLPEDFKEKTGLYHTEKPNRTMFFSGVYQVVKIESSIAGGEFTQVLHCVRMNNQKGKGKKAIVGPKLTKGLRDIEEDLKDKAKDALKKVVDVYKGGSYS